MRVAAFSRFRGDSTFVDVMVNYYMDYNVGSRIRVRLYNGEIVEAEITAITNRSTGRKVQIVYDNVTTSINPAQITEVLQ
jgi:hypothetical protein